MSNVFEAIQKRRIFQVPTSLMSEPYLQRFQVLQMIHNLAACDLYELIKLLRGDDGIINLLESTKHNIKI